MRLILFACAESSAIDLNSNRVSLFHIVDQFPAVSFPAVMPLMSVVLMLEREEQEEDEFQVMLRVALDGNPLFGDVPMPFAFQGHLQARSIGSFQGFIIPSTGVLTLTAKKGDEVLAEWKMSVVQFGQPEYQPVLLQDVPRVEEDN